MNAHSPRVWLIDIREEIAGIQELAKDADLAAFSASWAMKRRRARAAHNCRGFEEPAASDERREA